MGGTRHERSPSLRDSVSSIGIKGVLLGKWYIRSFRNRTLTTEGRKEGGRQTLLFFFKLNQEVSLAIKQNLI